MSRMRLFIENFLIYGLGGTISKIVPLIMLPVITRLMPNTFYFGLNDLANTVLSFGTAIAILGMYDAMFRMFFDLEEEGYKKAICSSALGFTVLTSFAVCGLLVVFREKISEFVFGDTAYQNLLILTAVNILIGATNSIAAAPTRMQNKRKIYLTSNIMGSVISYTVSILLLFRGHYLTALPLGSLISAAVLECFYLALNKKWFQIQKINVSYIRQMLVIALPLVPNFLIYWIFNSCDRLMIVQMLGNEYTGIYAVGAKVAQISQFIYMAFAGGWQYFAFSTMKDTDQVEMTSRIFEYLGVISFAVGMLLAAVCHPIFSICFSGDYIQGHVAAPWLFMAPLIQMLYQVIGNQFLVIKKTWPTMLILGSGAVFNVGVNWFLIPRVGIEGAAVATLSGYAVSLAVCILALTKMRLIKISARFYLGLFAAILYFIIWRFVLRDNILVSAGAALCVIVVLLYLYREMFWKLVKKVRGSL